MVLCDVVPSKEVRSSATDGASHLLAGEGGVARSNGSGGEEVEDDNVSPFTISPDLGALEAGWFHEVATLSR